MSSSEVLESDPLTRSSLIFHDLDPSKGDKFVLEDRQDVTELLEDNKRSYNSYDQRARHKGTFHRYAEIPMNLFMEMWAQGRFRGTKLSREDARWLDDPDNKAFRTRPGSLSR